MWAGESIQSCNQFQNSLAFTYTRFSEVSPRHVCFLSQPRVCGELTQAFCGSHVQNLLVKFMPGLFIMPVRTAALHWQSCGLSPVSPQHPTICWQNYGILYPTSSQVNYLPLPHPALAAKRLVFTASPRLVKLQFCLMSWGWGKEQENSSLKQESQRLLLLLHKALIIFHKQIFLNLLYTFGLFPVPLSCYF